MTGLLVAGVVLGAVAWWRRRAARDARQASARWRRIAARHDGGGN